MVFIHQSSKMGKNIVLKSNLQLWDSFIISQKEHLSVIVSQVWVLNFYLDSKRNIMQDIFPQCNIPKHS